jgi:hypothetical protein
MTTMRWEILLSSVAVIVLLGLGALMIPAERAGVPQDQSGPPVLEDTPEQSWEASAKMGNHVVNLELDPTGRSEPRAGADGWR